MDVLFYIAVGVISAMIAGAAGYGLTDPQYWGISLPIIIIANCFYIAVKK